MTYESDDSRSGSAPGKCLIIGDSMLQKVNPEGWDHEAYYFAYSGIKAKQLTQQIKIEVLPPPKDIGVIFLHVGTNNVSTRADLKEREDVVEPPEIAEDIMNVVDTLRKHYEYAHITVSAILPRLDPWKLGDLDRVNSINGELKRSVNNSYLKNLKFVDFSEHFISNWKIRKECYRFFYERQLDEPDLCHLSDDGNVRLNETLKSYLAGTMHEMRSKWPRDAKIIGQREWEEFRRRTFRSRDNPRFKYTNYLPSQKSYDRYIKSNPRAAEANGDPNPKKSGGGFNIAELLALKAKGRKDAEERAKSGGRNENRQNSREPEQRNSRNRDRSRSPRGRRDSRERESKKSRRSPSFNRDRSDSRSRDRSSGADVDYRARKPDWAGSGNQGRERGSRRAQDTFENDRDFRMPRGQDSRDRRGDDRRDSSRDSRRQDSYDSRERSPEGRGRQSRDYREADWSDRRRR